MVTQAPRPSWYARACSYLPTSQADAKYEAEKKRIEIEREEAIRRAMQADGIGNTFCPLVSILF